MAGASESLLSLCLYYNTHFSSSAIVVGPFALGEGSGSRGHLGKAGDATWGGSASHVHIIYRERIRNFVTVCLGHMQALHDRGNWNRLL